MVCPQGLRFRFEAQKRNDPPERKAESELKALRADQKEEVRFSKPSSP